MGCVSSNDEIPENIKIDGAADGKKYNTYWMHKLVKTEEDDAGDLDFGGIKIIGKITSVDDNGIATILAPIAIENTQSIKKIKVQMADGTDMTQYINSVKELRLLKINYLHIEAI